MKQSSIVITARIYGMKQNLLFEGDGVSPPVFKMERSFPSLRFSNLSRHNVMLFLIGIFMRNDIENLAIQSE